MDTVSYKCPNCGGPLQFDPEQQNYRCDYCLSGFSQEELEQNAQIETEKARTEPVPEAESESDHGAALLYHCPSCGAEIVTDETTAATFCFYCQNPVVLSGRLEGEYHPDYVIPFAIDRDEAKERFTQWIKKKKFVPNSFFSPEQIEKMTGVYFPYLLYSCKAEATMQAEGTKLRVWTSGRIRYTETKKYQVVRDGSMDVENVTRNALKKADKELIEGVLPFSMDQKKKFSMAYLSGFMAEKRDMGREEFEEEVKREVEEFTVSTMKHHAGGYDSLQVRDSHVELHDPQWKYALMPVWTLTYRDPGKDKIYYYALNGQTGKACGQLPVDRKKLAALFAGIFFPMLTFLLIAGYWI